MAETVPTLAVKPDWKTTQASMFLKFHMHGDGAGDGADGSGAGGGDGGDGGFLELWVVSEAR